MRLETDGAVRQSTTDTATGPTQRERGFADFSLGLKWRMQEGDEARGAPAIAWLVHVDVDSGSRAFRGQGARPQRDPVRFFDTGLTGLAGESLQ